MTRKPWTAKEDRLVLEGMRNGCPIAETAMLLGRPIKPVYHRRHRLRRTLGKSERRPPPKNAAEECKKPKADNAEPPQERKCLSCREIFMSDGKHNRVCDQCKRGRAWRSGADYSLGGML